MLENIKAVIFDADDTIINHKECEKQALQYMFNHINKEYKNEYQNIFRPLDRKLWDDVMNGKNSIPSERIPEYRFELFLKEINIEYDDYKKANVLYKEGFAKTSALTENAHETVKYLYDKGYRIYVITNGIPELQKPRIKSSTVASYISDIIVSGEVGVSKPDVKIFNILLEKTNLKSDEVIMIGDSLEKDVNGANNAHIKSIWYNPYNENNNTNIVFNYEIKNLIELKEIL